jgi:hypothetical protein
MTGSLEIIFLEVGNTGNTDFDFLAAAGALVVALIAFSLPFHYSRKGVSLWGSIELARLFDGFKFLDGQTKIISKYEQGKQVPDADVIQAAENIRTELVVVQSMLDVKLTNQKAVFPIYSHTIVNTIDSYKKYLKEFEPEFSELESPLRTLYDTAQNFIKEGKVVTPVEL